MWLGNCFAFPLSLLRCSTHRLLSSIYLKALYRSVIIQPIDKMKIKKIKCLSIQVQDLPSLWLSCRTRVLFHWESFVKTASSGCPSLAFIPRRRPVGGGAPVERDRPFWCVRGDYFLSRVEISRNLYNEMGKPLISFFPTQIGTKENENLFKKTL